VVDNDGTDAKVIMNKLSFVSDQKDFQTFYKKSICLFFRRGKIRQDLLTILVNGKRNAIVDDV
jgi:hypothetical protein